MTREAKNTVDYFPHMAVQGKTLFILKSRFGNDGYAFWFQLLEVLCREDGHYYDCRDETAWQYLLSNLGANEITGTEMLNLLAKLGNIDTEMWNKRVICCRNLIANLEGVYKKRGREAPTREMILDIINDTATEKPISGAEKPISGAEIPQSKVEYSRVYKNKVDKSKFKDKIPFGEFENVALSNEELNKLLNRFGEKRTNELIENLSAGIESKGYKYKSHYAAILNWAKRDDNKESRGKDANGRDTDKYIKGAYSHMVQR